MLLAAAMAVSNDGDDGGYDRQNRQPQGRQSAQNITHHYQRSKPQIRQRIGPSRLVNHLNKRSAFVVDDAKAVHGFILHWGQIKYDDESGDDHDIEDDQAAH